jgi:hypothetical protein
LFHKNYPRRFWPRHFWDWWWRDNFGDLLTVSDRKDNWNRFLTTLRYSPA